MKKKIPIFSVILYTLGAILLIYSAWVLQSSIAYISEMIGYGQLELKGSEYDIVSFLLSGCGMYLLFAVTFFALGRIMQSLSLLKTDAFLAASGFALEEPVDVPAAEEEPRVLTAQEVPAASAEESKIAFDAQSEDREV